MVKMFGQRWVDSRTDVEEGGTVVTGGEGEDKSDKGDKPANKNGKTRFLW